MPRHHLLHPLGVLFAALLGSGCTAHDAEDHAPPGWSTQPRHIRFRFPVQVWRKVDLLLVIDDSSSMAQEQDSLARNIREFARILESIEGGTPSLHVGVISSNVGTGPDGGGGPACAGEGDDGVLQLPAGCPAFSDGGRFLRHEVRELEGDPMWINYEGPLEDQLACMAQLGTAGCEFEQPLESMRRALSNQVENAGFLRDDAVLAVIFVGDEDDCSARDRGLFDPTQDEVDAPLGELSSFRCFEFGTTCDGPADEREPGPRTNCAPDADSPYLEPVSSYVEFLRGVKDHPEKVIVGAVTAAAGPVSVGLDPSPGPSGGQIWLEPQCVVCPGGGADCAPDDLDSALVAAAPAVRMAAFVESFPRRGAWQDICDYRAAAMEVDFTQVLVPLSLLFKRIPVYECLWGIADPPECVFSEIEEQGKDPIEREIPPCDESGGELPCYELTPAPECAPFRIRRDRAPAPDTALLVRCLAAPR